MGIKALNNLANLDLNQVLATALKLNDEKVKNVSRDQLARGETPSGAKFPKYSDPDYLRRKPAPKTAPGGVMNLNQFGTFYRNISPKVTQTSIQWPESQQDKKYPFLVKYSNTGTLLAWNERSIQLANKTFLLSAVTDEIKKKLSA